MRQGDMRLSFFLFQQKDIRIYLIGFTFGSAISSRFAEQLWRQLPHPLHFWESEKKALRLQHTINPPQFLQPQRLKRNGGINLEHHASSLVEFHYLLNHTHTYTHPLPIFFYFLHFLKNKLNETLNHELYELGLLTSLMVGLLSSKFLKSSAWDETSSLNFFNDFFNCLFLLLLKGLRGSKRRLKKKD